MIKRRNWYRVQFETEKGTQLDVRQNTALCTSVWKAKAALQRRSMKWMAAKGRLQPSTDK
jgi:hypothetical protein